MEPTRALWQLTADLLAADTGSLAAATALHVHLTKAPFTPGLDVALGDLTPATFTGSAAKSAGTGAQPVFVDMETGERTIVLKEPAGGWTWECTADPAEPETITGIYVTDTADAVLWGTQALTPPVTIDAADQGFTVGSIKLRFDETSPHG